MSTGPTFRGATQETVTADLLRPVQKMPQNRQAPLQIRGVMLLGHASDELLHLLVHDVELAV